MKEHVWTWPIASYLFLGGLGSSMTIVASVSDLFFGSGSVLAFCLLVSAVVLAFGSFLLIFELGRPLQFWRVFSMQKAVLTFGAWMVVLLMVINVVYFSFWVDWFPWRDLEVLRLIVAVLAILIGCGVLLYTGIELSSMKGRVLWNTPAMPILFAVSGLLTGLAADILLFGLWPYKAGGAGDGLAAVGLTVEAMKVLCVGLVVATLVVTLVYLFMTYTSSNSSAKKAALRWIKGSYAPAFWGGLVALGLVVPLLLFAFDIKLLNDAAFVLILAGGVFLRFLVVYSDDRRVLPGEEGYWGRLPKGHERFIGKDW